MFEFNQFPVGRCFFYAMFEFEGFAFGHFTTGSQQRNGYSGPRVFRPFAKIVGIQAFVQIVGDSAIQGLIGAANQIDDPTVVNRQ